MVDSGASRGSRRWRVWLAAVRQPKPTGLIAGLLAGLAAGASVVAGTQPEHTEEFLPAIVILTALATFLAGDYFRRLRSPDPAQPGRAQPIPGAEQQAAIAANPSVPAMLPVRPETFRGWARELDVLASWRADSPPPGDAARSPSSEQSNVVGGQLIMIHGRPGVGKSALALEHAHRIAGEYPGGVLYASLDNAGNPRQPAEVLRLFLRELGWTQDMPPVAEREALFRSLLEKRRRVLVVLDAASGADQVLPFVPTVPDCTVIVTSRRDLRPAISARAHSLHLDVPSAAEAAEIVRASAGTEVDEHRLCTAEIVHLCARLPLALRSAGEQAMEHPRGLCGVAEALRAERQRLDRLRFRGRDVRGEFEVEYQRLTKEQKNAFRLLALVRSSTFLPWVLQPLMDVPRDEAENLIAGLYSAQLVDVATRAVPPGLARYQFHPLVRLYAEEQLAAGVPEAAQQEARAHLNAAYLEGIEQVILGSDARGDSRRYTHDGNWVENVRNAPDEWVRVEYPNLVDCILAATDHPALCWRIAERLGDCVPYDSDPKVCLDAFAAAQEAAAKEQSEYGVAAVALARGSYLVGIERYEEGITTLAAAAAAAERCGPDDGPRLLALRAHRRIGEALLQMGAYGKGVDHLDLDFGDVGPEPLQRERRLIEILRAEAVAASDASHALDNRPFHEALADFDHDDIAYRVHLNLALMRHRKREWGPAADHLRQARALRRVDARRAASVTYRTARLWLSQALCPGTDSLECARQAASLAADAVIMFQRIRNPVGAIRARCLLVRALVVAGDLTQADEQLQWCRSAQRELTTAGSEAVDLITARIRRAEGELAMGRKDYVLAMTKLRGAAQIFEANGDAAATAEVYRQFAAACAQAGAVREQIEALYLAAGYYTFAGDLTTLHEISDELASVTRQYP